MTGRVNVLGVDVSAIDVAAVLAQFDQSIRTATRQYICVTGVHGVMEAVRDREVLAAHRGAGLVVPDGMPLVWLLRASGYRTGRVYGPTLMLEAFERSQSTGYRHFLYGASPGTIERLRTNLAGRFPAAAVVGCYAPPFRPPGALEGDAVIAAINSTKPDIVWVGLSTPKQELWMANHRARLTAPVLVGVGAAFDFHAGLVRQAPAILQQMGLEWAFRMAMEPRRLAGRYLRNNPAFIGLLIARALGLRHF
ncbi:MAG: WecB/TagA/CpsF family glycosyltransferase [Azospirillaceae bacterium]|nr:WecB/TagA/CpsF family glycosyltransferase [Azospirillaceae bacterium]